MDFTPLVEIMKQFGPIGLALILMGGGLAYLVRWLREDRKEQRIDSEKTRQEFLDSLKEQRQETVAALKDQLNGHTDSLRGVTMGFEKAIGETHKRLDTLTDKVDDLDGHVRDLRMKA